jgi:cystathionine beta-lyase
MNKKTDTKIVEGGRRKEWTGAIINTPVYRASTMLFENVAAMHSASPKPGTFYYGRHGGPTNWALEEALTGLEPGAVGTRLFPSGVAAIAAALLAVVGPGDELLMVDTTYGPTRTFCDGLLKRLGVVTRYYDPLVGAGIEELIGDTTRAIFMESPGSLTFEVQDVPAICEVAKRRDLVTLLDNTWATPVLFPALAAGVDVSILACTKYVGGHSDVMLGAVTSGEKCWNRIAQTARTLGQCASPDDAFLATRGLRTLGLRLKRHEENGMKIAQWLAEQPQVARILHPAFSSCPGHEIWKRDFKGAAGLFSFVLAGGDDAARARLVDSLEHFGIGFSWGGFESLVLPVDPQEVRTATDVTFEGPIVRLSVGFEDPDDLIADLARGFSAWASGT